MSKKECEVISLLKHCENGGFYLSDHAEHIVFKSEVEPVVYTINQHMENMMATWGEECVLKALEDIVRWKRGKMRAG